jgi:hypothetical protein
MMRKLKQGFLMFAVVILACTVGQGKQAKPEKVYRIVYEVQSDEWYEEQAALWEKVLEQDPDNPEAWYNYYNANRYGHFEEAGNKNKKAKLDGIIREMGKAVPDSYEYYLLKYWNDYDPDDLTLIEKAYSLDSLRADTYYPFITHYELTGNLPKLNEFCSRLYQAHDISSWLLDYNYNVLMSVEPGGILFTNGDNDTYPVWLLQHVKHLRPDVLVVNVSMATKEKYITRKLKEKDIQIDFGNLFEKDSVKVEDPKKRYIQNLYHYIADKYPEQSLYFALTVYSNLTDDIRDQLYVVGLAYKYSKSRIDNIALIKKNLENVFRLDYLKYDWYRENDLSRTIRDRLHMNYVVPMIILAEHYHLSGQSELAGKWRDLAMYLAKQAQNDNAMGEIRSKFPDLD